MDPTSRLDSLLSSGAVRQTLRVLALATLSTLAATAAFATDYYVSSSLGADSNGGTTTSAPFKTLAKINGLALAAGDRVLLRCGDLWRADILNVTRSGAAANPITYTSYPDAACADRPVLAGTQPIVGWTLSSGSIWVADLGAGANAGLFPNGINQLFRDGVRQRLGRWPNVDSGDGYSQIEAQPASNQIQDAQLPAVNWTGATAHIKGMRWFIMNRTVTATSGTTLTLSSAAECPFTPDCAGWGFFVNGHLATLDQEGEWYYDAASGRVYLVSATDPDAATIEGAVVMVGDSEYMGGIILGRHLQQHVAYVTLDNLELRGWFDNGVTTPVNLERDEHSFVNLRHLVIRDVDGAGIKLATWVWNAAANGNGYNGWRGGRNFEISDCTIEGANEFGIDSYARSGLIARNTIRNIARIGNVGRAGIGCSLTDGEGQCTEPGAGIRLKVDSDGAYSSNNLVVELNRLDGIGHNGMDVFGYQNTIRRNVIRQACATKGDCGAVRLFGGPALATSTVHDVVLQENILLDTTGNTDGAHSTYRALFGFGLYIDNYSRSITSTGNTVAGATAAGILYQNSTGSITANTLFGNSAGTMWTHQIVVTGGGTGAIPTLTDNVMVGFQPTAGTLAVGSASQLGTSDRNGFYHSSRAAHIHDTADRTLTQWRSVSGRDASSRERVVAGIANARLFLNDSTTALTLGSSGYSDLDGNAVGSSLEIPAFRSVALIPSGPMVSVDDAQTSEGDSGTKALTVTIRLSAPSSTPVTVQYGTADAP